MEQVRLLKGDNRELLKTLETNSVDSVVTDPPYALTSIKNRFGKPGSAEAQYGTDGVFQRASKGFMGKEWDSEVPSVEVWKEVLRVLKPGGHVLAFGGTRTYHHLVMNMELAGFEIRDSISYMYGSGFPKSHNIGKAVEKLSGDVKVVGKTKGAASSNTNSLSPYNKEYDEIEINNEWEGWGTALKPSMELICLARKPLTEKSIAENVLKHGTGGINIDDCRVGSNGEVFGGGSKASSIYGGGDAGYEHDGFKVSTQGRFPANTILECICDEVIPGENNGLKKETFENYGNGELGKKDGRKTQPTPKEIEGTWYKDTGDIHTNPECPCYILDKQSGVLKSGYVASHHKTKDSSWYGASGKYSGNSTQQKDLVGGASRYFYTAKVSKKERNMGLDDFEENNETMFGKDGVKQLGRATLPGNEHQPKNIEPKKNHHPTVKPINLMTYLCRLITPKGGVVLDMYMGSGSTGISALLEGFNFIGMEMDDDYFNIAEARINNYEQYRQFKK